jgi:hypothetical protein
MVYHGWASRRSRKDMHPWTRVCIGRCGTHAALPDAMPFDLTHQRTIMILKHIMMHEIGYWCVNFLEPPITTYLDRWDGWICHRSNHILWRSQPAERPTWASEKWHNSRACSNLWCRCDAKGAPPLYRVASTNVRVVRCDPWTHTASGTDK